MGRDILTPNLLTPYKIGTCEIPNRMVVPSMVTNYYKADGFATDQYVRYHERKAIGGFGLILTENYPVSPTAGAFPELPALWTDEQLASHAKLTEAVHRCGSKIFAQIYHSGRKMMVLNDKKVQVGPSPIPSALSRTGVPHELTVDEIRAIAGDFGATALRAKQCGFDGVELHGAHGYLICEFLSLYSNKRTDEYGGCMYNRLRFLRDIMEECRKRVGRDFPITIRLSVDEFVYGGNGIAEARAVVTECERMTLDGIHVSATFESLTEKQTVPPMTIPRAWLSEYAKELKAVTNLPIILVGRINDPLIAESLLATGKADFIALGRASLADPDFPNKVREGEYESIRQCIACNQGCQYEGNRIGQAGCLVNPEINKEYYLDWSKVSRPKKVYVAGGGVAGLEAARAAYRKGHDVTLFEAGDKLGGQFIAAAYPPNKGGLASYIGFLRQDLAKTSIDVRMHTPLTKERVVADRPDAVIVATGGVPLIPSIPGIDKPNVHTGEDILLGRAICGNSAVIIGGGEVGVETAAFLKIGHRQVTIVEMTDKLLADMKVLPLRNYWLDFLEREKIDCRTGAKGVAILDDGLVVETRRGREVITADTVILAAGYTAVNTLADDLQGVCETVISVGNALRVANALAASREGFLAGYTI